MLFSDISPLFGYLMPLLGVFGMSEEGDGGGDPPDFEATEIPADKYADNPNISKYKTVGDLIKGHGEAIKLVGNRGMATPSEKAKPEEWDKYYNSLGRPEKPDGYKFSPIENLHSGIKITPEMETAFSGIVHKHGLSSKQAEGMRKDYYEGISNALTKRDEKTSSDKHEAEKALRTEWGGEYDNNLNKAKRLIDKFGGADGREAFGELGNNPQVLKVIANISKKFSEDGFVRGNQETNTEQKDAKQKLDGIMMDKDHPYWNKVAGHDLAVEEVKRLQTILNPEVEV